MKSAGNKSAAAAASSSSKKNKNKQPQEEEEKKEEEEEKEEAKPVVPINLGKRVLFKIMGPSRRQIQAEQENDMKELLKQNYKDYLYLKQYNE